MQAVSLAATMTRQRNTGRQETISVKPNSKKKSKKDTLNQAEGTQGNTGDCPLCSSKTKPNCYTRIFDYYIENFNYDINIEFSNGEIYDLERIRDTLNMGE